LTEAIQPCPPLFPRKPHDGGFKKNIGLFFVALAGRIAAASEFLYGTIPFAGSLTEFYYLWSALLAHRKTSDK